MSYSKRIPSRKLVDTKGARSRKGARFVPSEIKRLLEQIELAHLSQRRGKSGLAPMTRQEYDEKEEEINQCHGRLLELIGEKATFFVEQTRDTADILFDVEYTRWEQKQYLYNPAYTNRKGNAPWKR